MRFLEGYMNRKLIYRRVLFCILFSSLIFTGFYGFHIIKKALPDRINVIINEEQNFDFHLPIDVTITLDETIEASDLQKSNIPPGELHVNLQEPFSIISSKLGNYVMNCKLFGLFTVKNVKLDVVDKKYLIASGESIGIYIQTDGVLVLGTGSVSAIDGMSYEPAYHLVQSGDYIVAVNGEEVMTKNELMEKVNQYGEEDIILTVRRNEQNLFIKVKPVQTENEEYKLGIWVRDNTQGIGTLTYLDDEGNFGALGHGINDVDTSKLMELDYGNLYETHIVSIVRGTNGSPGELTGTIDYQASNILGSINSNTSEGIFGNAQKVFENHSSDEYMEVGMKQEVKTGAAKIRCSIDGTVKDYDINITELNLGEDNLNKGIIFQVTDPELLSLTGGIVQGMSGSPIIQDEKLVGAVTHVFVQDATKGFGIFIENMLKASE